MLTTPKRISADIRRLCKRIARIDEPSFVDVRARSDSRADDCFIDAQRQVAEFGGNIQHGWMIWEWPGIMAEGVFHAVWRKPDGSLLDIARKTDGETRILFAPDQNRVFSGTRIDNVRYAIGTDSRIKEYIDVSEKYQRYVRRTASGVPFGTSIVIEGVGYDLHERKQELELALLGSRNARRANR